MKSLLLRAADRIEAAAEEYRGPHTFDNGEFDDEEVAREYENDMKLVRQLRAAADE